MQSFLGIVSYLRRYSPKIANLTGALRQVIEKSNVFKLEHHHQIAFKVIVKELSRDIHVTSYYQLLMEAEHLQNARDSMQI